MRPSWLVSFPSPPLLFLKLEAASRAAGCSGGRRHISIYFCGGGGPRPACEVVSSRLQRIVVTISAGS
uniref:Uncharacterized protein n=1 Tax=Oryza sativa subsp. japonica TaxID=39947 RepID=Q6K4B6_ORYSJ|nr:hypothetical protein [Oryza sativa Japonica Group]BAD34339.1 hypothetical protein [Oryza sativa Japonica Group]